MTIINCCMTLKSCIVKETKFVINNRLKGLNNWRENIVNQLETEIADLKVDFEHLDMIYNNSTCCSENHLIAKPCETCTLLENKVKYLIKTCARFSKGKANLEAILGSQNCVFGRAGMGSSPLMKRKSRSLLISFPRMHQVIFLWQLVIIAWEKGIFLKVAKLENMMYLRALWNGSQKD